MENGNIVFVSLAKLNFEMVPDARLKKASLAEIDNTETLHLLGTPSFDF